jgi:hypothetical protein
MAHAVEHGSTAANGENMMELASMDLAFLGSLRETDRLQPLKSYFSNGNS